LLDGRERVLVRGHGDEGEPPRTPCHAVRHEVNVRGPSTNAPEHLLQLVRRGVEGQVPNVQSIAHFPRFRHDSGSRASGTLPPLGEPQRPVGGKQSTWFDCTITTRRPTRGETQYPNREKVEPKASGGREPFEGSACLGKSKTLLCNQSFRRPSTIPSHLGIDLGIDLGGLCASRSPPPRTWLDRNVRS
jgi:hypothetical protein